MSIEIKEPVFPLNHEAEAVAQQQLFERRIAALDNQSGPSAKVSYAAIARVLRQQFSENPFAPTRYKEAQEALAADGDLINPTSFGQRIERIRRNYLLRRL
jgi:hypothetical protein